MVEAVYDPPGLYSQVLLCFASGASHFLTMLSPPKALMDPSGNTATILNSAVLISNFYPIKICHFVLPLSRNNRISSPGFLAQRFNNLQRVALLKSLIQYDKDSFQIWSTAVDYGKLCVWF